jgi:hypothetical protein
LKETDNKLLDEWLAFQGVGYVQRAVAARLTWRTDLYFADGNFMFTRDFGGTPPKGMNRWFVNACIQSSYYFFQF